MKKILLLCLILANSAFAQVKNKEQVPNLQWSTILNAPVKSIELQQLKGKLVWIEFWATWCGGCIVAMPHLQQLQAKYKTQLQVITVTNESVTRTKQFLKARPSNLWFAVDTGATLQKHFPHSLIPHSILIGTDGELIAATAPENITEKVIDSLLNKQSVHLPEKVDNMTDDYIKTYFFAADSVQERFLLQPEIKGASGMSTTFLDQPAFKGRRITFVNSSLNNMYSMAFGNFRYQRTIDRFGQKREESYCLDIIVKDPKELMPTLKTQLLARFDLQAKTENIEKEVYLLKIGDINKFNAIPRNRSGKRTYYSRHGEIDQQSIDMPNFADYLETFGTYRSLIVDETGNKEKLDIKFSFQPENPASLTKILNEMGLVLEKAKREITFLVLYK